MEIWKPISPAPAPILQVKMPLCTVGTQEAVVITKAIFFCCNIDLSRGLYVGIPWVCGADMAHQAVVWIQVYNGSVAVI